jgi:hypothetical protein
MKMSEDIDENLLKIIREVWPDPETSHVNHLKFAELLTRKHNKEIERLKGYIEELERTVSISALAGKCTALVNEQLKKENKRLMIYRKAIHKMCSHRMKTVDHYIVDAKQAVAWYEDLSDEAVDKKLEVDDYIRIAKQAHLDAGD